MGKARLILVGGFLGAGKTTLLLQIANRLTSQGNRIGLITNDQAPDLVDTGLLSEHGTPVAEVAGSCFCCNFPGFIKAVEKLQHEAKADIIIAEPVGSCTDLSATILQPLKDKFHEQVALAPFSVLVDPQRVREIFLKTKKQLHDSAAYIVGKQMEEADTIIVNKSDTLSPDALLEVTELLKKHYPNTTIRQMSALTGAGIEDWLSFVLEQGAAGSRIVDVDYDTYAKGEAVLGWLNAAVQLSSTNGAPRWEGFLADILSDLKASLQQLSAGIGHIKLLLTSGDGRCLANLTQTDGAVSLKCDLASPSSQAEVIINARVEMSPEKLEHLVREQLIESASTYQLTTKVINLKSLMPGRPNPTYRYDKVIGK